MYNDLKAIKDKYKIIVEWSPEDNCYLATAPELEGCQTHGDTEDEALANAKEAVELHLEALADDGEELPLPESMIEVSGNLPVRMPKALHKRLLTYVSHKNISANEFIVGLIEKYLSHPAAKFGPSGNILRSPQRKMKRSGKKRG